MDTRFCGTCGTEIAVGGYCSEDCAAAGLLADALGGWDEDDARDFDADERLTLQREQEV